MMREVGACDSLQRLANDAMSITTLRDTGDNQLIGYSATSMQLKMTQMRLGLRKIAKKNRRLAMAVKIHILQVDTVEKRDKVEHLHTQKFMNAHCVLLVPESVDLVTRKRKKGELALDTARDMQRLKEAIAKVEGEILENSDAPRLPFYLWDISENPDNPDLHGILQPLKEREREQTAKLAPACKKKEEEEEEAPKRKRPKQNKEKKKKKKQRVGNMVLNNAGDGNFTVSASFDGEFGKIDDNIYTTKEKATTAYDDWKASKEEEGN
jgi:hypothetical protein